MNAELRNHERQLQHDIYPVNIEIPGGRIKYEFNPISGTYRIDRRLPRGLNYPIPYGFIPNTKSEDGDPVDILLLTTQKVKQGMYTQFPLRVLGIMYMNDENISDPKIIFVDGNPRNAFHSLTTINEIPRQDKTRIETFFNTYKRWQGKTTEFLGWGEREEAIQFIQQHEIPE